MNHRLTSALMLLILASSEAFSTVSTADSFLGSSRSVNTFQNKPAPSVTTNFRQNEFGSASRASSSSLKMAAGPVAGAIAGALTGGFFAGGLHAIAGEFCRHRRPLSFSCAPPSLRMPDRLPPRCTSPVVRKMKSRSYYFHD